MPASAETVTTSAQPRPPWRRRLGATGVVVALAAALTAGAIVIGGTGGQPAAATRTTAADAPLERIADGDLASGIAALQTHLRTQPKDAVSWATLGAAYVEQARTTGDPTRYPQAEEAFDRSMTIQRKDNDAALAGRAALAAARHDFPAALRNAESALTINAYNERALAVRIDALVELGRYDAAFRAARHADSIRPGIPIFTRYAYVLELRGDPRGARRVLLDALGSAVSPGDIAYVTTALGQLAWSQGDYTTALKQYAEALRVSPSYLPALDGRGRTYAARGELADAARDLAEVVRRYPLPAQLAALGEVYEAQGDRKRAKQQYGVVGTWIALARANGVATDLDTALVAADHGDREEALRAARAEWQRRHSVHTADALAWALHVNGHDHEALTYAKYAAAPGYRNALFLYHRGMIERALGHRTAARTSLIAALKLNPGFSPTASQAARTALHALGGAK
jgi:tetratricopeptide (TPR) repeat protein